MSRSLRLEYPGAVWHITSRGNERKDIFRDDTDRERFLSILSGTIELFGWRLHAFVLMGNHYHLLLETPEPTLSRGMRQLNGVYTQAFNRRHHRVGHLFQGRFKAVLVQKETHLLELARYVVLNPVRARLARTAANWKWTSYRMTAGLEQPRPWLSIEWTLQQFGDDVRRARRRYRDFVSQGKGAAYHPWEQVKGQIYLGSASFAGDASKRLQGRRVSKQIPRAQRAPVSIEPRGAARVCARALDTGLEELQRNPRLRIAERRLMAYALRRYVRLTLGQIGAVLNVGEWQASTLAKAGEAAATSRIERRITNALQRVEL